MAFGIDDAVAAGLQVINKFVPDPQAKIEAEAAMRASLQQWDAGQIAVNTEEAKSANLFVAGWRPAAGWVCVFALAYAYVLVPLVMYIGFVIGHPIPKPPVLDNNMWELMTALLGIGGMRTYEKLKGIDTPAVGFLESIKKSIS